MFSYIPYSDSPFYPQSSYSYNPSRSRSYTPAAYPYGYARALAEERSAAARRAAAEEEARAQFARYQDDDDEYEYSRSYSPRQRAYLEAQRRRQVAERERARLIVEEKKRREAENRARREQEVRASLQEFYHNLGLRTPDVTVETQGTDERDHAVESTPRTPSPTPSVPFMDSTSLKPSPPTTIPTSQTNMSDTNSSSSPIPEQTAATKIQTFYRTHKALATISELEAKFEGLKRAFALPEAVDYLSADGEVITLKVDDASAIPTQLEAPSESTFPARLAFTPTNVPIRSYDEDLNRILTKLDAVESWGQKKVRQRRRDVVRNVELEAARIETVWAEVWKRYISTEKAEEEEVNVVLVDVPDVLSAPAGPESIEMTVEPLLTPASVEHLPSATKPATGMSSEETPEGTFMDIPSTTSLRSEEVSTPPILAESRSVDQVVDSRPALEPELPLQLTPTVDATHTRSENAAGEASDLADMESGDSDYESISLISGSSEEQDEKDDLDNSLGDEQDVDFVIL